MLHITDNLLNNKSKLKGFLEQFKYIESKACSLEKELEDILLKKGKHKLSGIFSIDIPYMDIENNKRAQIGALCFEYIIAAKTFNFYYKEKTMEELEYLTATLTPEFTELIKKAPLFLLPNIVVNCKKAIGIIESILSPLTKEEIEKLTPLREELEKISEKLTNPNFGKNMNEALNEYEKGHFLASALISSKVIISALDKIPGELDDDKAKLLQEKNIIEAKTTESKKFILKAGREARNFFSHNIDAFPNPSDISLLGDATKILGILSKFEQLKL